MVHRRHLASARQRPVTHALPQEKRTAYDTGGPLPCQPELPARVGKSSVDNFEECGEIRYPFGTLAGT